MTLEESTTRKRSLAVTDNAIERIRELIVSGEWGPGTRLPREGDLAKQFGVTLPEEADSIALHKFLEARRAETAASIDNVGKSQGPLLAIESAVKDTARFGKNEGSNGWGYFAFGGAEGLKESAAALPTSASCYSCHAQNTAVDNTFVQFYPTLFEVAKRLGTVKPTYDPAHKL